MQKVARVHTFEPYSIQARPEDTQHLEHCEDVGIHRYGNRSGVRCLRPDMAVNPTLLTSFAAL